jgi:hypothetical protein
MLNKIAASMNLERRANGEKPKTRPVGTPTCILRCALSAVNDTPSGKRTRDYMEKRGQMGLGTKGGCEKMAFAVRSAAAAGHPVETEDVVNGFNELARQAVLTAASKLWPEATGPFTNYYGHPSIVIFAFFKNGVLHLRIIISWSGTRQGCPLASVGFDMAMEFYILRHLRADPRFREVVFRALTDDLVPILPKVCWEKAIQLTANIRAKWDELANPIFLKRHEDKGKLLLPDPVSPQKRAQVKSFAEGLGIVAVFDGVVIAGTPIGVPSFIKSHAEAKVKGQVMHRFRTITSIAGTEPQMAVALLSTCSSSQHHDVLHQGHPHRPHQGRDCSLRQGSQCCP